MSWSHNGKPIQAEAGRVNLVFDGINATVEILNAFPDYEGEWTCSAFNSGMFLKNLLYHHVFFTAQNTFL